MIQVSSISSKVGRTSGSSFPVNLPYKEMAGNCEALLEGKPEKVSSFTSSQPSEGQRSGRTSTHGGNNQEKEEPSRRRVRFSVNMVCPLSCTPLLIWFNTGWREK